MGVLKNRTETLQKKIHQQRYSLDFEELFMAQVAKQQHKILESIQLVFNDFKLQTLYQMKQNFKKIEEEKTALVLEVQLDLKAISTKFKDVKNETNDQLQVQLKAVEEKFTKIQNFKDKQAQFEFVIDQGALIQAFQKVLKFKTQKSQNDKDSLVKLVFPNMNEQEEEKKAIEKEDQKDAKFQEIPLNNQYLLQYIQATSKLQVYNIQNLSVTQKHAQNFIFPQLAGSCMLGNHAYIVGGLLSYGNFCNSTIRVNADAKVTSLATMTLQRSSFPITFNNDRSGLKNKLLIVSSGGHNSTGVLKDCQVYDIYSNKWNTIPRMNEGRELHASCLIEDHNICFVFSGQISPYNFINSVERVTINCSRSSNASAYYQGQWQKIQMTKSILGDFRLCAIYCKQQGRMLLFGGGDNQKKVYKLNCQSGQIEENFQDCSLIPSPYYCSVFGFNEGMIYCVGYGNDSFQALPQLFKWNGSDWCQEIA